MTTIATVEDDPRLSELVTGLLELEGYTVAPATTVRAQALIDRVCPDLVILDLGLPDGDGLDFLAALRLGSSVPVLVRRRGDLDDGYEDIWVRTTASGRPCGPWWPSRRSTRASTAAR